MVARFRRADRLALAAGRVATDLRPHRRRIARCRAIEAGVAAIAKTDQIVGRTGALFAYRQSSSDRNAFLLEDQRSAPKWRKMPRRDCRPCVGQSENERNSYSRLENEP